jgi:adenine-specific DNA-methyltransferase
MKGFVPTPTMVVDPMVARLFRGRVPTNSTTILDPGCGTGVFIDGVLRWCSAAGAALPRITGIESEPGRVREGRTKFRGNPAVRILERDFLGGALGSARFDFIIGNPPYVPITGLTEEEKASYRATYSTATGRFDLYLLFFEQALRQLKPGGRLVFITPEKFLYVATAAPLRRLLGARRVEELHFLPEDSFEGLVTYPLVTTLVNSAAGGATRVMGRNGARHSVRLPSDGSSWLPIIARAGPSPIGPTLEQAALRVSPGVATGADSVFVRRTSTLEPDLRAFAYPTISGRELEPGSSGYHLKWSMLTPYDHEGHLLPEDQLGALGADLRGGNIRRRLEERTCVARKPWYAFHETPPLADLLRPKILCKDIVANPEFWSDVTGTIIPRHSVYYIVPRDPSKLVELAKYLNSTPAKEWLRSHCQRAANGFLRLQSASLKQLPVPRELLGAARSESLQPRQSAVAIVA